MSKTTKTDVRTSPMCRVNDLKDFFAKLEK